MAVSEKIIFWDWNGTLLDDTKTCLATMNTMLAKRHMPPISIDFYRNAFGFPVIEYYRKVGFDFKHESFEELSVEFIGDYNSSLMTAPLVQGAEEVLRHFRNAGKRNIILSAMKQDMLVDSVTKKGLEPFFTDILGIDNIFAAGKSTIATGYVLKNEVSPGEILLIGDTVHDFEVAQDIQCRCILIADGHQAKERLAATGALVVDSIIDLLSVECR